MANAAISAISTDKAPKAIGPYSQAICFGGFVFSSGQIPLDPATGNVVGEDIRQQTTQVLKNLGAVLSAAGCSYQDVVKTTIFLEDLDDFSAVNEVYASFFTGTTPARSTVQAARLPRDVRVEIDAIAAKR
ncbi:MAG: RidA family protein [Planctomycetota bacterium]|nr:RidA family protein [Planctomycetota bacterium]